jgi:hypothetical protein
LAVSSSVARGRESVGITEHFESHRRLSNFDTLMTHLTLYIAILASACVAYLIVNRKGLATRDLVSQLLVTLVGTYLGFAASLQSSRQFEDEKLGGLVVGQSKIALSWLNWFRIGYDTRQTAEIAVRRLAALEGANRVLGVKTVSDLDTTIYYAQRNADHRKMPPGDIAVQFRDLWSELAISVAAATNDESLTQCRAPERFRACEAEVERYVNSLKLTSPDTR